MATYEIDGVRWDAMDEGLAQPLAEAHASHARPLCLCQADGVPMYVARSGDGWVVKRMPFTGPLHSPECESFDPPAEWSGLAQVLGSAINEDPGSGLTALKLGFSLSRMSGRTVDSAGGASGSSVKADASRLSLRGLLHYLWDQAELTRWHPGFAGKRSWATVRRHLLGAASDKVCRGESLLGRLYVPEAFSVDEREAIAARRRQVLNRVIGRSGVPRPLMLLIGEVKEIAPARHGFKVILKHVPDQSFSIDQALYRRLERRFETELSLWGTSTSVHLMMIATFGNNGGGVPVIEELSLMPVTSQWIPIEDGFEGELVDRLARDGRSFAKCLRFNLSVDSTLPCAVLTDTGDTATTMWIDRLCGGDAPSGSSVAADASDTTEWTWKIREGEMPSMPVKSSAPFARRPSSESTSNTAAGPRDIPRRQASHPKAIGEAQVRIAATE